MGLTVGAGRPKPGARVCEARVRAPACFPPPQRSGKGAAVSTRFASPHPPPPTHPPQVGAQARLMSLALRKVAANASKSGVTIIFLNQLRYKVRPPLGPGAPGLVALGPKDLP